MFSAGLSHQKLTVIVCLVLAVVTLGVYWPFLGDNFINLDDPLYITQNNHVQGGLNWPNVAWAFTNHEAVNWHPLTWLSHMLDCQWYGLKPAGHHLTSLLFHVANTLLLFLWLSRLTGGLWRSAFVAALFAWHPLHVESVAWASERKDVLSTFFWLLAMWSYERYVALSKIQNPKSKIVYLLTLLSFAFGLMSKPMVVTLPLVLLLLDFWPLNRLQLPDSDKISGRDFMRNTWRLVLEKLPFFVLALADCLVTYTVQKSSGALWSSTGLPPQERIYNALVAYLSYLSKLFWPVDLAVIYPFQNHLPFFLVIGAALLLAMWTCLFFWRWRRNPYLVVGWLWFLGTLMPVIGLVQVGSQSMADRYSYVPSIGLFILVVWGVDDLMNRWPKWKKLLPVAGGIALAGCLMVTSIQISYWRNSISLFLHAVDVTADNYFAYNALGDAFKNLGQNDRSLAAYEESVRITPRYPLAQFGLATALLKNDRPDEAIAHFNAACKLEPHNASLHYDAGRCLFQYGRLDEASAEFSQAVELQPDFADAQHSLAITLVKQGRITNAIPHFAAAVQLEPDDPDARFNLGLALLNNHQPAEAAVQFAEEIRLAPDKPNAHFGLAQAFQQQNRFVEAVQHYRETLRLAPNFTEAKAALDAILTAHPE